MSCAIVFDTEYTAWEGSLQRGWSGPNEYREVVQIGAVKIDAQKFEVLDTFELLIKPVRNPQLSDYFIKLTGITQAAVDAEGVSLAEGVGRFMAFAEGLPPMSYGADMDVLTENMRLLGMPVSDDFPTAEITNLAPWMHRYAPETATVHSGWLAQTLGVPLDISRHTGLGDSLSIVAAIRELVLNRGAPSPFISKKA